MNHFWRNLTSFTKRERKGSLIFIILILATLLAGKFVPEYIEKKPWYIIEDSATVNLWIKNIKKQQELSLHKFNPNKVTIEELYDMGIPSSLASGWVKYIDAGGRFYRKTDLRKIYGMPDTLFAKLEPYAQIPKKQKDKYFYQEEPSRTGHKPGPLKEFDPNTFTKQKLIGAGIKPGIAENIINYRNAGGNFKNKKDLLKIYAIDSSYFNRIKSYLKLNTEVEQIIKIDSVELNSASVEELMQLKIKKSVAHRIINYRKLLGGFFTHQQLKEVYEIDSYTINKLHKSSWIDTLLIDQIEVNEVDEYELAKHPYLNRKSAEQIRKYRDFATEIESFDELFDLGIIEEQSMEKLRYYLLF